MHFGEGALWFWIIEGDFHLEHEPETITLLHLVPPAEWIRSTSLTAIRQDLPQTRRTIALQGIKGDFPIWS